jgi:serine/threonine-protein kinase
MSRSSAQLPGDPFGWVGAVLDGSYLVGDVVEDGGVEVVHSGTCLETDERVAIKFLNVDGAIPLAGRERFLSQFIGEGRLLSRLAEMTSGVVHAIDVGAATAPGGMWTPYLVLEWLTGTTLKEDLAARAASGLGGRTLREAIDLLGSAARAIEVAHEHGLVHRDIHPGNLVITEAEGRRTLKVLDFGVAKIMRDVRARTTEGPTMPPRQAFWPMYGAPEQFEQRYGATGPWTDVFALALVLVEIVTGRRALEGDETGSLYRQVTDEARRPTLRTFGVGTSDEVEGTLQQALAVEPRHRHRSAGDFWEAIVTASLAEPTVPMEVVPAIRAERELPESEPELLPDEADWDAAEAVAPHAAPEEEVEDSLEASAPKAAVDTPVAEVDSGPPIAALEVRRRDVRRVPPAVIVAVVVMSAALLTTTLESKRGDGTTATSARPAPVQRFPALAPAPTASEHAPPAATVAREPPIADSTAIPREAETPVPSQAAATPRARPTAPSPLRSCPNCATHPYQCGKFSLPQGRGDCYCGCSANSHCGLPAGRSTGPCVPNEDGVTEAL